MPNNHPNLYALILKTGDFSLAMLAGVGAYAWRFETPLPLPPSYTLLILLGSLLLVITLNEFGIYRSWRGGNLSTLIARIIGAWIIALLLLSALLVSLKAAEIFSRLWLAAWALSTALGLIIGRIVIYSLLRWIRQRGKNHKKVVIIGISDIAHDLTQHIMQASWTGFDIIAIFDDTKNSNLKIPNIVHEENLDLLDEFIKKHDVQEVWITLPLCEDTRLKKIMDKLRHTTADIRLAPGAFTSRLLRRGVSEIVGIPMLDLSISPMTGFNRFIKAFEDRILALLIIIITLPLMSLIALAIKISSPGPVLFKQTRLGWDGKPFTIYKFRTMFIHEEPPGTLTQAKQNDPRVTRLGAWLRRTSLDELPQFFNVLQGHMSIVGPRPHAIEHHERFKDLVDDYMKRHKVKPGITGWAQIHGYRGEVDNTEKIQKRIEYDLYYIENWSIWLDLRIIMLTLFKGLIHKNAY